MRAAQRRRRPSRAGRAVEQDAPLGRLVEAGQQLDERGLAGAVLPDQRQALPARDEQVDVAQRPAARCPGSGSRRPRSGCPRSAARPVAPAAAPAAPCGALPVGMARYSNRFDMYRLSSYMPPSAAEDRLEACWPWRNATRYSVMSPSESAPARRGQRHQRVAAVERAGAEQRQQRSPSRRAAPPARDPRRRRSRPSARVAAEQQRPEAEELHLLGVLVVGEHVLEVVEAPRLGRAPVAQAEGRAARSASRRRSRGPSRPAAPSTAQPREARRSSAT